MKATIAILPGDGIGPEVMRSALKVLDAIAQRHNHEFRFEEGLIGGVAIDRTGNPLPDETLRQCEAADAILLAAVGGPKWDDPAASVRPEQGLLRIRKHFDLFANLRPVKAYSALAEYTPLRSNLLDGVDMLFVRELTGGLYFGPKKERGSGTDAYDTLLYSDAEVERVAHVAFRAAQRRRKRLTSVDKANVLASMRLWRAVVNQIHEDYADIQLDHVLVDACTMHLLTRPASFDVILAGNMFGDILSDEASVFAGSLGMLASASLGDASFGLYEPVHGSAPDISGQNKANPIGIILSVALMLRYSLNMAHEAEQIENAVEKALNDGLRTADIADSSGEWLSTDEFTQELLRRL